MEARGLFVFRQIIIVNGNGLLAERKSSRGKVKNLRNGEIMDMEKNIVEGRLSCFIQ